MKSIEELKNAFKNGQIAKPDFIYEMHEIHRCLFEYAKVIKDTDIAKIEIQDDTVVMTTRELGIKIICDQYDERIIPLEIINFGEFEGEEQCVIRGLIKSNWTIFDVGANIGWYSLNLAKSFSELNIHAFEPIPSTFKYLQSNLALNEVSGVEAHNFGLSNVGGAKEMYFYREGMGNASLSDLSGRENVEKISTQFITMDEFATKHDLKPDFIKCDVEGSELFVFQGGIETLKKHKPIVFTEMLRKWSSKFNYHPNDIIDLFFEIGYGCYVVEEGKLKKFGRVDEQTPQTNYLFIHQGRLSEYVLK